MRFGEVAVKEAEGAILAHTHRLGPGLGVLKKGRQLSAADLDRLIRAGLATVTVAWLDKGDLAEDEAAARLAESICGEGLIAAEAATGRVNLFARDRGVLVADAQRIDALNGQDEAITVATRPNYALLEAGEIAATVKIIPFAAPEALVDRCCAIAAAVGAPLMVSPLVPRQAGLVLTRLPRVPESLLDRATVSLQTRLERLGCQLTQIIRCDHDLYSAGEALELLAAEGCDLLLMLGASAIVDRHDVLPSAVQAAGGEILHLGMPVDPGNLILLARLGKVPVVGVPGCARSLKPSGFDQVLQRLVAGLPVGAREVMAMGVGGLLAEIEMRGHPRERGAEPRAPRVAGLVMAAGRSTRMGETNKLLAEVEGAPMVVRAVDALLASGADPVHVVTGHEAVAVAVALGDRPVRLVHNPRFAEGMSTSLVAGVQAALEAAQAPGQALDGLVVALGDMPWVKAAHVDALIARFDPAVGSICVPVHNRKRGHPVLWPARLLPEMTRLTGDVGARALLEQHADQVLTVPLDDAAIHLDIDTPETLAAVTSE